jgi:predicted patatin/cPLA2 family phospholipase
MAIRQPLNITHTISKKRIHFILPGGGVNGAFQAGFIYRLMKDCSQYIEITRVDGISVGALNEHRSHIFDSHPTNRVAWEKGSLYDSNGLREIITIYKDFVQLDHLKKYHCVVHNSNTNDYEYINGDHCSIWDYVIASSSPPIISPYSKIGDCFYTDGGVDLVYPVDNLDTSSDIRLIVGYYEEKKYYLFKLYKKLKKSIDTNIRLARQLLADKVVSVVMNPCRFNIIDFRREVIDRAFQMGEEAAIKFYTENIIV